MAVFWFAINVICQVIWFRAAPKVGLLKSEYLGFAAGFICLFIYESYNLSYFMGPLKEYIATLTVNLIIYTALSYCYFHFINLGETARRIRILREIRDSADGLTQEEILSRYSAEEIFERRIERLLGTGQVVCKDGKYFINSPVLPFIGTLMQLMKSIIPGKRP